MFINLVEAARISKVALACCITLFSCACHSPQLTPPPRLILNATASARRTPVVEAVERAAPAVVSVLAEERPSLNPFGFFGLDTDDEASGAVALGSGVIFDDRGHVITNEHVVAGAARIKVQLSDGRELPVVLVGADRAFDLAVLRIEGKAALRIVPPGISSDLMIGETVIAIGNPFGLAHTVTTGVISAVHRTVRTRNRVYEDFLQTDAPINPGNSGGPLLNIRGELVGINTAVHSGGPGIGFAIPVDRVRAVVQDLVQFRRVRQGWLGVQPAPALPRRLQPRGVLVGEVEIGSPAERAGVRVGDLILAVAGTPTPSVSAYRERARHILGGDQVTLKLQRGEVTLQAQTLEPAESGARLQRFLGLEVSNRGGQALIVQSVARERGAHRAGLQAGDIILQVGRRTIRTLAELHEALAESASGGDITMLVVRGAAAYYAVLPA